ncbi:DEAD/DEAH box helicase [Uliginosibacterium sp. 31-12]|uniref:DEAD/DEAH box helicase n=1 Tax=Uliginosibacterium sp. 31-12 TaxID=3062781 RepID=UPI0026E24AA9|nr:DEAD/DEAH box helicase [Uliginosibacterium sp. 31-12]MDO6386434.1 DEAD/DEAH box helicase [Uliginosibacterium sp. 31-12]
MHASAPARHFTRDDILRALGPAGMAKGEAYVPAVSQLHVSDFEVSALVQGTERRPYTVRIVFHPAKRGMQINASCTCPVGSACKHCVATLLAAIEQRGEKKALPDLAVLAWLRNFREEVEAPAKRQATRSREQLFYLLEASPDERLLSVRLYKIRPALDGGFPERPAEWSNIERALIQPPAFVDDNDIAILRALWLTRDRDGYYLRLRLDGCKVEELLPRLLATGRCHFSSLQHGVLQPGPARSARLGWQMREDGCLHPAIEGLAGLRLLPTEPPWYLDEKGHCAGPLELGLPPRQASRLLGAPPLRPVDAAVVARELAEFAPDLPRPQGRATALREVRVAPQPRLRLYSRMVDTAKRWRQYPPLFRDWLDFAQPAFDYAGIEVALDDTREFRVLGSETVRLVRDTAAEQRELELLARLGFEALPRGLFQYWSQPTEKNLFGLAAAEDWQHWMSRLAPALRAAGWALELTGDFRHHIVEIDDFFSDIEPGENGWLEVSLGFELEGRRVELAPLLAGLLEHPVVTRAGGLDKLADDARLQLTLDEGQRVSLPVARIRPVLRAFLDLFDGSARLRLSPLDAARLSEIPPPRSQDGLRALQVARQRLHELARPAPVAQPPGMGLQLRPYQLEGLAWLQQLRALDLAGILADDMGLGKTAQTLAHLLTEKQAGRLERPALVVLPTSLVFNWQREAAHIAPALRVLALHGPQRDFAAIGQHDVVLTTYPLVWRDAEQLKAHSYHLLILDEAQTVKNAASKAAATVRELDARHRLCLTGTPMENHLGELWSQFDFLLPGFLGDNRDFTRRWRTPIEKNGDSLRRELLSRRVKPFILRRRKEDVASELPPKNIVLRTVELAGSQRDLYETVRAAMDEKVRAVVADKGFKRSQIVILDALLKLRQVCCDPRLLDLASAQRVKERAKLDLLMEMLPELIEEGRRVLLFSQFTNMLSLIEAELKQAAIGYVKLTGQTRKRQDAVETFQSGKVPLFLISLKAGGVGLNLTAADTVIHFDPWWNPAAEDQATDRAHRIGQSKSVFVYKLIAAGSIEERIVALQEKKSALAAAVLSGDAEGELKFSEADIAELFAPLPE